MMARQDFLSGMIQDGVADASAITAVIGPVHVPTWAHLVKEVARAPDSIFVAVPDASTDNNQEICLYPHTALAFPFCQMLEPMKLTELVMKVDIILKSQGIDKKMVTLFLNFIYGMATESSATPGQSITANAG